MKYDVLHIVNDDVEIMETINVRADARRKVLVQRAVNAIAPKMMELYGKDIRFTYEHYGIAYNCDSFLWATDKDGKEHYVYVIRCKDGMIAIG